MTLKITRCLILNREDIREALTDFINKWNRDPPPPTFTLCGDLKQIEISWEDAPNAPSKPA